MAKQRMIKIRYKRSVIGRPKSQKLVIKGLGFSKLNQIVERPDNAQTRGMVQKVHHLVEVLPADQV